MQQTPNMGLTIWDLLTDNFSHTTLAADLTALDQHDHTSGKGVPVPAGGLAANAVATSTLQDSSVTGGKLAANAVTTTKVADSAITTAKIADGSVTTAKLASGLVIGTTGTLAARPAANSRPSGFTYFATDDWGGTLYEGDGVGTGTGSSGTGWTLLSSKNQLGGIYSNSHGGVNSFTVNGNAEGAYRLEWAFHVVSSGGPFWLRFNGDTAANYSTDVNTDGSNHAMLLSATGIGTSRQAGYATISASVDGGTDRFVDIHSSTLTDAGVASTYSSLGYWTNTATNITTVDWSNQFNPITGSVVLKRLFCP